MPKYRYSGTADDFAAMARAYRAAREAESLADAEARSTAFLARVESERKGKSTLLAYERDLSLLTFEI
jgi:broad specificity phosphatase PhoE